MAAPTGELTRAPRAVLCPIDFSDPARGALRYAMTVAAQANATLTVLTVNDLLLAQASDMARGGGSLDAEAREETERFIEDTFSGRTMPAKPKIEIATGTPDAEILRIARDQAIDVIVMSSRGATGLRKLFLGSTTERVLRGTTARVLVTRPAGGARRGGTRRAGGRGPARRSRSRDLRRSAQAGAAHPAAGRSLGRDGR